MNIPYNPIKKAISVASKVLKFITTGAQLGFDWNQNNKIQEALSMQEQMKIERLVRREAQKLILESARIQKRWNLKQRDAEGFYATETLSTIKKKLYKFHETEIEPDLLSELPHTLKKKHYHTFEETRNPAKAWKFAMQCIFKHKTFWVENALQALSKLKQQILKRKQFQRNQALERFKHEKLKKIYRENQNKYRFFNAKRNGTT